MKTKFTLLIAFLFFLIQSNAQQPTITSFGGIYNSTPEIHDEISPEMRRHMQERIKQNIRSLAEKGVLPQSNQAEATPKFILPLQQSAKSNLHNFYGISNFVDLDPSAGTKDFNCLRRTYNGHQGTDFFTAPFPWKLMETDAVEIVAAADGIIVGKEGSMPDTSCAMCPTGAPPSCWYWNAIYLQHADGTLSIYGHMKTNSLTTKEYGDEVKAGEFLGIVGSSGNSTGPHLHFEVWSDTFFTKRIDPWLGSCNNTTDESYWQTQEPYYVHNIMDVISGSDIPTPFACYDGGNGEKSFAKDTFNLGETIYFTSFVRDNLPSGPRYYLKLYGPGNNLVFDWYLNPFSAYYPSAYFYYYWNNSVFNKAGEWKFNLKYGNDEFTKTIYIQDVMPLKLLSFAASPDPAGALLTWETSDEVNTDYFSIERSNNGVDFSPVGKLSTTGINKGNTNKYQYIDKNATSGLLYYRLKMIDLDKTFTYSAVQKVTVGEKANIILYPNPADHMITLKGVAKYSKARVTDMAGLTLITSNINGDELTLDVSRLKPGMYLLQVGNQHFEKTLKLLKK